MSESNVIRLGNGILLDSKGKLLCQFSHRYACWANHRNNWAIRKADNRKLAKARLKQIERQQIRKELEEYDNGRENQEA